MAKYKVIKTFKNGETNTIEHLVPVELLGLIKADTGKFIPNMDEAIAFYEQYDFRDFTVTVAEKESLYKQLKAIITKNNTIYEQLSDEIFDIESDVNESAEAVEHAKYKRWQFMHDYATELSTFIWDHITVISLMTGFLLVVIIFFVGNIQSMRLTLVFSTVKVKNINLLMMKQMLLML